MLQQIFFWGLWSQDGSGLGKSTWCLSNVNVHTNVSDVDVHWGWAGALRVPLSDLLSCDASWSSMGRSRVWEALNYYFWGVF